MLENIDSVGGGPQLRSFFVVPGKKRSSRKKGLWTGRAQMRAAEQVLRSSVSQVFFMLPFFEPM
jgi:hypothetical protein